MFRSVECAQIQMTLNTLALIVKPTPRAPRSGFTKIAFAVSSLKFDQSLILSLDL